ncbi:MAG: HAD-IA family hydrolase, partial [Leptolyngbyaceae cyanobacterium CRU_2_3]|nr:HAD-IA family hydrolase [Leptolyngbyaceae cyanobacterium CRU_2_3]
MLSSEVYQGDRPQAIFLDAVGTLFGVKGGVGAVYREVALKYGVDADADILDRAFYHSFKHIETPMAFADTDPTILPLREYDWWEHLAHRTFQTAGMFDEFSNFADFFAELYAHFATAAPWFIYPDVLPALKHWHSQEIPLGVLSNFDTRLHPVLAALGLSEFFTSVTVSTEVGVAKPHPKVFKVALEKHGCLPEQAWHIGDSFKEDYQGAIAVGIR